MTRFDGQNEVPLIEDLRRELNRHSAENGSNTPDFVLAGFLDRVLDSFDVATRERDRFYGVSPSPGDAPREQSAMRAALGRILAAVAPDAPYEDPEDVTRRVRDYVGSTAPRHADHLRTWSAAVDRAHARVRSLSEALATVCRAAGTTAGWITPMEAAGRVVKCIEGLKGDADAPPPERAEDEELRRSMETSVVLLTRKIERLGMLLSGRNRLLSELTSIAGYDPEYVTPEELPTRLRGRLALLEKVSRQLAVAEQRAEFTVAGRREVAGLGKDEVVVHSSTLCADTARSVFPARPDGRVCATTRGFPDLWCQCSCHEQTPPPAIENDPADRTSEQM